MGRSYSFDSVAIAEFCKTNSDIAAQIKFGCSRATISNACRTHGVVPRSEPDIRRKRIADWIMDGQGSRTIEDAINEFKVSRNRVVSACRQFGVTVVSVKDTRQVARGSLEILAMLWSGLSQSDISLELCVSRQRVEQVQRAAEAHRLFGENSIVQAKKVAAV